MTACTMCRTRLSYDDGTHAPRTAGAPHRLPTRR
jgi:hypothetical protein